MTERDDASAESAEDRLIGRFFKPLATDPRAFGLVDDVATMVAPDGYELVLKADAIVGGVHFLPDDPPDLIARKALRVNLSDLAAKGAGPSGYLLTLALPPGVSDDWLAAFARGLGEDQAAYGCPLLGGDTVATPGPVMVSITVIGLAPAGTTVRRSTARPGDRILATGTFGDAVLGLKLVRDPALAARWGLDAGQAAHLADRYRLPRPRNAVAEVVREFADASMDVSDGLAGDLAKMCRASGVTAEVTVAEVPLSSAGRRAVAADPALIEPVLTGGDDYEVLACVPPEHVGRFLHRAAACGVAAAEIGGIVAGTGAPQFRAADGRILVFARASFSHF